MRLLSPSYVPCGGGEAPVDGGSSERGKDGSAGGRNGMSKGMETGVKIVGRGARCQRNRRSGGPPADGWPALGLG